MNGAVTMDHRMFHQAWLGGRLAPGVYRVVNPHVPRAPEVMTIPRRTWKWARTGRGKTWHHVRCIKVRWRGHGADLVIHASCGMPMHTNQAGPPVLGEAPKSPVCGGCARALEHEVAA